MTKATDPAFTGPTDKGFTPGLTKLEYFAGLAMQGLLATQTDRVGIGRPLSRDEIQDYASESVTFAIELIKELRKLQS